MHTDTYLQKDDIVIKFRSSLFHARIISQVKLLCVFKWTNKDIEMIGYVKYYVDRERHWLI